MLKIRDVSKSYGSNRVVNNVSLDIEKGKLTSFVGPNGAGKSTLLSIIVGLLEKESGEIYLDDRDINSYKKDELSKKISILRQSNNLNIRLTIRDLVSFGRFPYSKGRLTRDDEKFIDDALEYMKLCDIQDKFLDEISGGQRQRAFIAMVIAQATEYIFLDEPLNNLDMSNSVQMMKVLRKLCDDLGKTIVVVMHDINFASCYSDYVVAFKDGIVYKEGKTSDIIDESVLEEIYQIKFDVKNINGNKISIYY
ncbi:iron ABC transporter ATP-binding protein [Candidatus Arthromitus sp. SFB-rat-Yit]|uniref:iron ABC transporter ATP-binding protein n=1 Tax=Candidatus Arthromitus sp. SFB-rat-Yit TaxID=1041504 RepID=UPI000227A486|nr:ATP-binding cassette domain-containing protein [Candidatus Arthromitus sp. SFB-rat-Yit]BAK81546.1 putative iron compound ABC transporter, ATP-binding protein [Candidatus Arthromitus sp. SFB-rat-Yit]